MATLGVCLGHRYLIWKCAHASRERGRVKRAMEDLLHAVEKQLPLPDMHELQQELHEVRGLWVGKETT